MRVVCLPGGPKYVLLEQVQITWRYEKQGVTTVQIKQKW